MKCSTCQSCGLSFSKEFSGTNRDRSINDRFCRSCFADGRFTDPQITIDDLERRYLEMARHNDELTLEEAERTIKILPDLDRWKMTHIH